MVKGIHKKIIEINHPDSAYFEKAIFYLRPGITQLPAGLAQAAAAEHLQDMEPYAKPPLWKRILPVFCAAVLSSIATCLIFMIF